MVRLRLEGRPWPSTSSYLDHFVPNSDEVRTALLDENRTGEHREGLVLKERM